MPKGRILAVDDQRYFRDLLEEMLTEAGFEVQTAAGAEEALLVLEHSNFDFLFAGTAVRNFARYSPQVFEPDEGVPDLGWALFELAARMNGTQAGILDTMLFEGMLASFVGKSGTPCADVSIDDARAKRFGDRTLVAVVRRAPSVGRALTRVVAPTTRRSKA